MEGHPNPIPFLILATVVGALLGSWWVGLLVGIGMTIIPGLSLLALFFQNIMLIALEWLLMLLALPFILAYRALRGSPED